MDIRAVVIDGDAGRLEGVTHALQAAGIAATGCAQPQDAVARVREVQPALVILSDDLPGGAARGILAALRKDKATRDATYMVLTAGAPREVAEAYAEHDARAHDFAPRAITPEDLVARSKRLLASQGVTAGGISGFSIGVTGNPQGPARAAVVASSTPGATPAAPAAGGRPVGGASGKERGPVVISYTVGSAGDKSVAKTPGMEHGAMSISPSFDAGLAAPAAKSVAKPASADERVAAAPDARRWNEAIQALLKRAAAADDPAEKVAALEQILVIAHDEMEDITTAVMTAEKIVEFDPGHATAVSFLREVYKQLGAKDKLAAVEDGFRRAVTGR